MVNISMRSTIDDFVKFVAEKLRIDTIPKVSISNDSDFAVFNRTFGIYYPDQQGFTVEVSNRNIVDILRTIAHEMTHHRQMEVNSSKSRTDLEIEATAAAGMLVKLYCEKHPDLYKTGKSNK